eukprot:SAG31_NODE_10929_length_1082_cov_1.250254_2_plen_203_part_00
MQRYALSASYGCTLIGSTTTTSGCDTTEPLGFSYNVSLGTTAVACTTCSSCFDLTRPDEKLKPPSATVCVVPGVNGVAIGTVVVDAGVAVTTVTGGTAITNEDPGAWPGGTTVVTCCPAGVTIMTVCAEPHKPHHPGCRQVNSTYWSGPAGRDGADQEHGSTPAQAEHPQARPRSLKLCVAAVGSRVAYSRWSHAVGAFRCR